MPDYAASNALRATASCRRSIGPARRHGVVSAVVARRGGIAYSHHIQRLMVTGNFAFLAGLAPAEIERWYLAVYADAFEWVEMPNTLGMAVFADGGQMASKPYAASGAYIDRMSDFCARVPPTIRGQEPVRTPALQLSVLGLSDREPDRLRQPAAGDALPRRSPDERMRRPRSSPRRGRCWKGRNSRLGRGAAFSPEARPDARRSARLRRFRRPTGEADRLRPLQRVRDRVELPRVDRGADQRRDQFAPSGERASTSI